jgi:hypothetical protein
MIHTITGRIEIKSASSHNAQIITYSGWRTKDLRKSVEVMVTNTRTDMQIAAKSLRPVKQKRIAMATGMGANATAPACVSHSQLSVLAFGGAIGARHHDGGSDIAAYADSRG